MIIKDFGFTVTEGRQIDLDKKDKRLAQFILDNEPSYAWCIGCGGCTSTCSTGNFTDFNIRKMNFLIKRGETELVKDQINACMLCGKCTLVCPRGVNTRNVILQIKNGLTKIY